VRAASELDGGVAGRLARACTPVRARALALAAVRETFEEVGLRLGRPDPRPGRPVPAGWRAFFEAGLAPTLEPLAYVARAVTPPYRPIRFNARFFMADARHADGDIRGSGELENIHWVPIAEARRLPIPGITGMVLEIIEDRVTAKRPATNGSIMLFQYRHGRHIRGVE
jgi:8-oxo-dGTP pyrophosphatase MutT (NUDIX family)